MEMQLPFGTQFSPNQIELPLLLKLIVDNEGDDTSLLIDAIVNEFFKAHEITQQKTLAGNCKNSLVSYGILESGGGVHMSSFGHILHNQPDPIIQCDILAKHILKNLSGMIFIDVLRSMNRNGEKITKETVVTSLNSKGFQLSKTSNNVPVIKLWLEKAGVLKKWRIDEGKLSVLIELSEEEFTLLKTLKPEQYYFLRTLCNIPTYDFQKAAEVRSLASATFGFVFGESNFSQMVIQPLETQGLIEVQRATTGHGARSPMVKLTDLTKKEVIEPLLNQLESQVGKDIVEYLQKTLKELREDIDAADTHQKGLALEAFAIKIMRIIGLDFIKTRLKGTETAGAEVDVIFDSSRLIYSRWQVQCKNTSKVSLDQIAKEVGLSHVLKTNAIVIMTTGIISDVAREYATHIMKNMHLCIIMIEGEDIQTIIENPTKIIDIFNRESLNAKQIKLLNV